jgi:hypothetical protein
MRLCWQHPPIVWLMIRTPFPLPLQADCYLAFLPLALTLYVLLRDIRNTRRHRGGTTGAETCAVPKNSLITPDCAVSAPILTYGISGRNTLLRASRTTGLSG